MKTIAPEAIDAAWEKFTSVTEAESRRMAKQMQRHQGAILVYLLAMDENPEGSPDHGRLLELGAFVWEVMRAAHPHLRTVSPEELEACEGKNIKFLEDLDAGAEMEHIPVVQRFLANYNQQPLLGAMLEALMEGHEEHPELAPDHLGLHLLYLKTVIDALDQ